MRWVAVVVPARDEEDELPGCLRALARASERTAASGVHVTTIVTADRCRDRTSDIARSFGARVVETEAGAAGAARAAGFAAFLGDVDDARDLWLATTDADSRVPVEWLVRQIAWAGGGWEAVAGTVRGRDWFGHPPETREAFEARYRSRPGAPRHVHGANLGFSAVAYLGAGGFAPIAVGEDRALVAALKATGRRVLHTDALQVLTSTRTDPRAPGGFGHDLLRYDPSPREGKWPSRQ